MNSTNDCNHAVGLVNSNYDIDLIRVGDDPVVTESGGLYETFNYCPFCGEHVLEERLGVERKLRALIDELRSR